MNKQFKFHSPLSLSTASSLVYSFWAASNALELSNNTLLGSLSNALGDFLKSMIHVTEHVFSLSNAHHSKSRDNNLKLPPGAATCRSFARHWRPPFCSRQPPLAAPQSSDPSRPP